MVESLARVIAEHPFFEDMEKRHVQTLAGCAKNVRFEQGQVIFREGDAADEFYFIRKGLVAVEMMMPSGFVTVQTVGEGEMLGWSCFVPPYQWHFGTRTLQPVLALSFDGKCLRNKCNAITIWVFSFFGGSRMS